MAKILTTLAVVFFPVMVYSQGERFLENINFNEGDSQTTRMFFASLNADNSGLAACHTTMEFDMKKPEDFKMKTSYSSLLLNLVTGRVENNLHGTSAYYLENNLVVVENTEQNGKWIKFADFGVGKTFYEDKETRSRKEVNLPEKFQIIGAHGKYLLAVNFFTNKSIVLEPVNESLTVKHQFDLFMIKVTDDGKSVYGVEAHSEPIKIFDLQTGQMLRSVNVSDYGLQL